MSRIIYQVISALILQFNCMMYGMTISVPATMILLFKSENTTLDRPMTLTETSLLASLSRMAGLISTPFMAYLIDSLGRKRCTLMLSAIGVTFWIMLVFVRKVEVILFTVFLSGLSSSMFLLVSVYVAEISQESIRGRLCSFTTVSYNLGMLVGFMIGGFLEYQTYMNVGALMALIGILSLAIVKESPVILMKKGLEKDAANSMAFYRNSKPESKLVSDDLDKIRRALTPKSEGYSGVAQEEEKLTTEFKQIVPAKNLSKWEFFKQSESTRRAFYLNLFLVAMTILQGMAVIQTYAKPIFHETVPEHILSTTWCCVLLSIIIVVAGLVGAYLTDKTGRRTLMISSTAATGLLLLLLGTQIHFKWGPPWIAPVLVYLYCISFTFGPGNIPFVLLSELYLPEIKGVISTALIETVWGFSFTCVFLFNPLVLLIGLGPVFYLFATASFCTATVCYFALPETKGLTVDVIQTLFVKKKNIGPA